MYAYFFKRKELSKRMYQTYQMQCRNLEDHEENAFKFLRENGFESKFQTHPNFQSSARINGKHLVEQGLKKI